MSGSPVTRAVGRYGMAPAGGRGWTVVDMQRDWNKVFASDK